MTQPREARRAIRRDMRRRSAHQVFVTRPSIFVSPDEGLLCRNCGPDVERNEDGTATCKTCNRTAVPADPGDVFVIDHTR